MSNLHARSRRGTVIIIVAAMAAMLAAMALAFLVRTRSDVEETQAVVAEAQARIMLIAACTYLQEASRIGWDDPSTAEHEECFGWIDVRDGRIGPKFDVGTDDDHLFPIGSAARCPMDMMQRPPYAIAIAACANPILTTQTAPAASPGDAEFGRPFLVNPDPQPAAAGWADYASGDPAPRRESLNLAWFRCYREDASRFVITCGAGGTNGFRDWNEVVAMGAEAEFGLREMFDSELGNERRLWYLVEWSAAIGSPDCHNLDNDMIVDFDNYLVFPMNTSHTVGSGQAHRTQSHSKNLGGTMRWIQRLREPPTRW